MIASYRASQSLLGAVFGSVMSPGTSYALTDPSLSLEVLEPTDAAFFAAGESVPFVARADDEDDGEISEAIVWVSSLDGLIGSGAVLSPAWLSAGAHVITVTVVNTDERSVSEQVRVIIGEAPE